MKKNIRMIAALVIAMIMIMTTVESASAATFSWSSTKTPGYTSATSTLIKMPLYKGKITFKVTSLSGNCSCLLGQVVSAKPNYCYVNTSSKSVMITKVGGEQAFNMGFTYVGLMQEYMYLSCSVVQNASIGELVYGSGTLSY